MRHLTLACCLFLAACSEESARPVDPTLVTLAQGDLVGDPLAASVRYTRIPYARPPVGPLRWKAPAVPEAWDGVRHETTFASPCPQQASSQGATSEQEDCLYLNVWTATPRPAKAPVMVWIHGGGNFAGSASDRVPDPLAGANAPLWYDGQTFAEKHGIVVVSLNYRLGPLGFFSHPALAQEGSPRANQGLLDQKRALEWVRDNIAAFGGDPSNVTIFGESAGSADVCFHVISPQSRGLFHRAISESGGCTTSPRGARNRSVAERADEMRAFASALGCPDDDNALACLRAQPVASILAMGMQPNPSGGFFEQADWTFEAIVDGPGGFVPEEPRDLLARGDYARVPYLLGSNTDEGTLFTITTAVPNEASFRQLVTRGFGAGADALIEAYPVTSFGGDYQAAYGRMLGDSSLVCGTHEVARYAAAGGSDVYMYNFNVPWTVGLGALGAAHASEISHVFGTPYQPSGNSQQVSEAMNGYWASFARGGDPNYEGAPARWPKFSPTATDDDQRLQLDERFMTVESFRKNECAAFRAYYAR